MLRSGVQIPPPALRYVEGYPSGQRGRTVNPLAEAFGGSNPPPSTRGGRSSGVEHWPSKPVVAGSNPVARSRIILYMSPRSSGGRAHPW